MANHIKVVRIEVFRSVTDEVPEDAQDAEMLAVEEVCGACPGAVVQVYDNQGRYLYTPQGEEDEALIHGEPAAGSRAVAHLKDEED